MACLDSSTSGLADQYFLRCPNIDCSFEKAFWSSSKAESCRSFNVNKQLIYAMRRISIGWSGINTFFNVDVALEVMKESAEEVYNLGI